MKIYGGCASERGNIRPVNEDAVFCRVLEKNGECFALGAVCDGVGGLDCGEMASALITGGMEQWFASIAEWLDPATADGSLLFSHLKDGVEAWNYELVERCRSEGIRAGSTLSLIMLAANRFYIIQVGDSRIYRYRDGLSQLTRDESRTRFKDGQARSYLANYMGRDEELCCQAFEGEAAAGDLYLFCSDGCYHQLTEEDVAGLSSELAGFYGGSAKRVKKEAARRSEGHSGMEDTLCDGLVQEMIRRGDRDNISAGLFWIG